MNTKKLTVLALFTTISLVLSLIDSMLPPPIPVPGVKLGLANIAVLYVLLRYDIKDTFYVLAAKIILTSFFAGQFFTFFYSLSGGLLSLLAMIFLFKIFGNRLIVPTSIGGAVFHNLGQFAAALLISKTPGLFAYLPVLFLSGVLTGLLVGLCCQALNRLFRPHTAE